MRFPRIFTALFCVTALGLGSGVAVAGEMLQPFVLASTGSGSVASKASEVKAALQGGGFEVVGEYSPYDGTTIVVATNASLKANAAKSEHGGYGAVVRVAITKVDDEVQVTYSNPVYWSAAFRLAADNADAKAKLASALGAVKDFGTSKELDADALREYHYMIMMEYFDDPSELASYDSYSEAVAEVEKALAAGLGGTAKVYRVDIPGKDETVFGVALKGQDADDCSGDEYIMSRVDKEPLRSSAHLPYEILVSGDTAYALYARFRIALSWPHLPMIASETGATFFSIMCAPDAIEEALIMASGEEP